MKDLYIAELERIQAELEKRGLDFDTAYRLASERAYPAMQDRLADMYARLKDERRENGC